MCMVSKSLRRIDAWMITFDVMTSTRANGKSVKNMIICCEEKRPVPSIFPLRFTTQSSSPVAIASRLSSPSLEIFPRMQAIQSPSAAYSVAGRTCMTPQTGIPLGTSCTDTKSCRWCGAGLRKLDAKMGFSVRTPFPLPRSLSYHLPFIPFVTRKANPHPVRPFSPATPSHHPTT